MNKNKQLNHLFINQAGLLNALRDHYVQALRQAEPFLIENMKKEMGVRTHGCAPGKPEWITQLSGLLQETYLIATDNYIESGVGIPESVAHNIIVRAMIIEEGSGSKVGNGRIKAGPSGRMVWDDSVSGQKPSQAKSEWFLPEAFNQEGNHFVENAVALTQKHFDDVLSAASKSLPSSLFYGNVDWY